MKASTQSTVHAVIKAAFEYAEGIEQLRKTFKGKERDAITKAIIGDVASYPKYLVPLVDGEGKAKGTKVLDKTHAKYEACRKALQRIVNDIMGKSSAAKEEIEVPAEILAVAAKLAKMCAEYEDSRKLASTAVAQAFAK
jgi:hypothetical protein